MNSNQYLGKEITVKMETEITVKVTSTYEELHNLLISQGLKILDDYQLDDIYVVPKDLDIYNTDELEVLKHCVLIRDVANKDKKLVYKYKKYKDNGDIIEQGKTQCKIEDIDQALNFMKAINYIELFKINDHVIVYGNKESELCVQLVNDKYIFIEIEEDCHHTDRKYTSIEEMINDLEKYNIEYDKSDYYVKKALISLKESKTV